MSISYVKSPKPTLARLEDSIIWQEACSLAELIYSKLGSFPEDEKWATERKLRNAANDLMFYAAEVIGGSSPTVSEYGWSNVRKSISILKTMYRFAGRQKFIELEPEVMVRFDKFIKLIDDETTKAYEQTEVSKEQDLTLWREKYKLWKATEK